MSAQQKRVAAQHLVQAKGFQERRVCRLLAVPRSSLRYQPKPREPEEQKLIEQLKSFAKNPKKRRRGYRLVYKEIKRQQDKKREQGQEATQVNHKRIYRLWRSEGLSVPPRRPRKRIRSGKPATELVADRPNSIWCFDFVKETTLRPQSLRIFCVSDEFTREVLAIEVGIHFVSERVVATLENLMNQRALPGAFRMDNGPEFIALVLRGLCYRHGINAAYIDPGCPPEGKGDALAERLCGELPLAFAGRVYGGGGILWSERCSGSSQ